MGALVRCLLATALAVQFALAGLCLAHDERGASSRVIHFPCAHQYQTHTATLRPRPTHAAERTVKRRSVTTAPPPDASFMLLRPHQARDFVALQSQSNEAESAVLSARGPPCPL
jgi:hypothetical protein